MPSYTAPRRDIQFLLHEVLGAESFYKKHFPALDLDRETMDAVIEEGAKFTENELAPLFRSGDEEGCHFDNGVVTTPKGFKEAYAAYVEGGWAALSAPEESGGQGLPNLMGIVMSEMVGAANWSWGMYPGLSHGAVNTVELHGTPEQKETYLTKLVSGEWAGTMCLTEPHCGSDLGILRTKAEPNADGSYAITGTKIFISAGEHDLTDNIVHIVLARLPDAPKGTKGISLFIVPKFLPNADGSVGERNAVACGSIEHKMGIKASATCVMNFDSAKGFLISEPNKGLNAMFIFMNTARIGTALQGICSAELSFQNALTYAKDRLAMRSLTGSKAPEKEADPIIVHPDVRRMLLTQKAVAEGGRALCYFLSMQSDVLYRSTAADEAETKQADELMALLTPIAKAFLTEMGLEAANLGMQIYGGHGYIAEWGMEQMVRDARIATIYEGTTGIQALDLLGRKVLMTQGQTLKNFTKMIHVFCKENANDDALKAFVEPLMQYNKEWGDITMKIGMSAMQNHDEVGGAAYDFLMYSGFVTLAYFWAVMAKEAQVQLAEGSSEKDFYESKIKTAKFYFARLLPRALSHAKAIESGVANLLDMGEDQFIV
jgi:alkylation response protein AidB-like acyl-CoA dehydrogenase